MIARNIVVFDIDGTLADPRHRLPNILNIDPPDWATFDLLTPLDLPFEGMIRIFKNLAANHTLNIILLTSRTDRNNVRRDTIEWLRQNGITPGCYNHLVMRSKYDQRPSLVMKLAQLQAMDITPEKVMTIFEDQPDVITGLRAAGYHVCDVGGWEGGFKEIKDKG